MDGSVIVDGTHRLECFAAGLQRKETLNIPSSLRSRPTHLTNVRAFASMRPRVNRQRYSRLEGFPTVGAFVNFHSAMRPQMHLQGGHFCENHSARFALVILFGGRLIS